MARSWKNELQTKLLRKFGSSAGNTLYKKYEPSFPDYYHDNYTLDNMLSDINQMETLSETNPNSIELYQQTRDLEYPLHLRLFQLNTSTALSDILPILENMGLRTIKENAFLINLNQKIWISDFSLQYTLASHLNIKAIKNLFEDGLAETIKSANENDGFNKLILAAEMSWRDVSIIRAYAKYLKQIGFRFSQMYIEQSVTKHYEITKNLVQLFKTMHQPQVTSRENNIKKMNESIKEALENITSLDEDMIMRQLWKTIKATLRTNFYQTEQGKAKPYFSFKLRSAEVPNLPLPQPLFEIFVYSPRFEAIHLRAGKVARGGLRWSDRREDFRTEVLGLMKAQKVKNSVIVPSGAKGGFVLKKIPLDAARDIVQTEVITCYTLFMRGLLDLTDNLKNGKPIPPKDVVCYDEPDPYLVVAADKGTATFSDIANSISLEYNFWLGDAFASGGSTGYDHKKMGITARGAWESIKRHFRDLNINISKETFTMVGIGDMSGDVFGNGALYCKNALLVAAFDHRHIFLDPNPNMEKSFQERARLFKLPTSSWEDFNSSIISKGGGIYKRSSKSISITPEVKKLLDIKDTSLTPNELIIAILRAPVTLLFNGGIGTYVKATTESHADVGDKANEFCRVNGADLRCKVVGEGGNLGFTQLGRVEYALQDGLINTDFIDNSAGVDCSDHEVNIKILLNKEVAKGNLTEKKRNTFLEKMTNEVKELVLKDNYNQALVMSFSTAHANKYVGLYKGFIKELETLGVLDRAVEFLPDDKKINERISVGKGLTSPELAVLLAYAKIHLKNEILHSTLPEDTFFNEELDTAFPAMLCKQYESKLPSHDLRREIIATQLSNQLVNSMGITFAYRIQLETGASLANIVKAYVVASSAYRTEKLQEFILSLDFKIPLKIQYDSLHNIRRLMNLATRWFLKGNRLNADTKTLIEHYTPRIEKLEKIIPHLMSGITKHYLSAIQEEFSKINLPKDVKERFSAARGLYTALNIVDVATQHKFDLLKTAELYFKVGEHFNLVWFRDQILSDSREGHWNTLARLSLRDELDVLQRQLTIHMMQNAKKETHATKIIDQWRQENQTAITRWEKIFNNVCSNSNVDYIMFFISLRELADLLQ